MAKILDGKALNEKIAEKLKSQISGLHSKPRLVIIQLGNLPESNAYIARKVKFGQKVGAIVNHQKYQENITQNKLITLISSLNTDPTVTGIIVQMPLPKHLDKDQIIDTIDPEKDVDGLTSRNLKLLWEAKGAGFMPATTKGIISLLDEYKIPIAKKHVIVVGRSFLVGKPTALAFLNRDATVTIAHSKTRDLPSVTKTADILVAAAGQPKLITKEYVLPDQVVIDVGINVTSSTKHATNNTKPEMENLRLTTNDKRSAKLVGDVDFEEVSKIVAAISPVPGGIGPMTVASLFENLLEAYNLKNRADNLKH